MLRPESTLRRPRPTRIRSAGRRLASRGDRGFTLLELIVVITIIGLLGTLVVTRVAPLLFQANKTKIKSDLKAICEAARQYQAVTGSYPESIDEMVNATDEAGNELPGLEKYPKDPWQNDYIYELREGKPFAQCLGKDQTAGGDGDDADYEEPEPEGQA